MSEKENTKTDSEIVKKWFTIILNMKQNGESKEDIIKYMNDNKDVMTERIFNMLNQYLIDNPYLFGMEGK